MDESEILSTFPNLTPEFVGHLKTIINNVSTYYENKSMQPCGIKVHDGIMLKEEVRPLDSVGVALPAGTAPLVSSVYMTAVPAISSPVLNASIIVTPPNKEGKVNPYILAVANLLKVKEIYGWVAHGQFCGVGLGYVKLFLRSIKLWVG